MSGSTIARLHVFSLSKERDHLGRNATTVGAKRWLPGKWHLGVIEAHTWEQSAAVSTKPQFDCENGFVRMLFVRCGEKLVKLQHSDVTLPKFLRARRVFSRKPSWETSCPSATADNEGLC